MLNEKIYQMIFDELHIFLTPEWEKLIIYLEYGEGSYAYSFYEKRKTGFVNGYDLPGVSEKAIDSSFKSIDRFILNERNKEKSELWTNMTMIVDNDGNMHTDFDYTNLTDCAYEYSKEWKSKYLK